MSIVSFPRPFVPSDPAFEALERQDVGSRALPVQDADAFPADELTEREIDELFVAEMTRRDAEAASAAARYAAEVAEMRDQTLVEVVAMIDGGTAGRGWCAMMGLQTTAQREAFLSAAAAEVLRRID